jgi:aryl-alcohol dehydrogenase-like predicted oxidoreductase
VVAVTISSRRVPGTELSVSSIGLVLEAVPLRTPGAVDGLVALLRRARASGVTTFELPTGAGVEVLERAVATAFPEPDPRLTILSERSSEGLSPAEPTTTTEPEGPAQPGSLRDVLQASNRRLRPHRIHLIDWVAREGDDAGLETELEALRARRAVEAVVRRVGGSSGVGPGPRRGDLWSGPFSLLDDRTERRLEPFAATPGFGYFARDPFDGGRLDGRRLTETVSMRRPDVGPVRLRELEQEFAPVLSLGFLTDGKRRTLAQAALRYVLRWPWVCSVLVPLPAPERLGEVLAAESVPPLSEEELSRLAAVRRRT